MENWQLQLNNTYETIDFVQDYFNLKEDNEELNREKERLSETIEELRMKAEAYDRIMDSTNTLSIREVAKTLGISGKRLFEYLRVNEILCDDNLPVQKYLEDGYFKVLTLTYKKEEEIRTYQKTVVTGKGLAFIEKLYGKTT